MVTLTYEDNEGLISWKTVKTECGILTFDPAKNAIQSDAPVGSDTF